jgi:hypothetical protein
MSSHNQMNDGAKQGDFLGQEKLILGHNMRNNKTNRVTFLGQGEYNIESE